MIWRRVALLGIVVALAIGGPAPRAQALPNATGGWPLSGRVAVLRDFDPPAERWLAGHRGIDLAARVGDPVLASRPGWVSVARMIAGRGVVVVRSGGLRTTYEPVVPLVVEGQAVAAGEIVGRVAAGTHCGGQSCLHWGLRRGEVYLDPRTVVVATPVRQLPATAAAVAARRAAGRAAAAREPALVVAIGPPGRHGFVRPVKGRVSSPFGLRLHPLRRVWTLHDGTDFAAPCGAPIVAAYGGVVRRRSRDAAYGNRLFIDHGRVDGHRVQTAYNHAVGYAVQAGERVAPGQRVGRVGSTGLSTGCHLHLMLWVDGQLTDPMRWLSPGPRAGPAQARG